MELVRELEVKVAKWLKKAPHLPVTAQGWLAVNAWWIVLIATILAAIAALGGLVGYIQEAEAVHRASLSYYGYAVVGNHGLIWTIQSLVSLIFVIIVTLLFGLSIRPLKALEKQGWVLLFVVLLVEAVAVVVNAVLGLPIGWDVGWLIWSLVYGAVGLAIGAYFIYEIRGYFSHSDKQPKK